MIESGTITNKSQQLLLVVYSNAMDGGECCKGQEKKQGPS